MMRKLKRKLKRKHIERIEKVNPVEDIFEIELQRREKVKKLVKKPRKRVRRKLKNIDSRSKKIIKKYPKQRCAHVYEDGKQCRYNAVGKSTLCKKHGGNPVIEENLITKKEHDFLPINTKFNPAFHPVHFIDLSRAGLSEVEIAAEFEISVATLKNWTEKYAEFNLAYEIGKALHESWWLQQGKSGLNNRNFNTSLFKFLTGNKLGYSDKMESKNLNMNVHGVLMVPDKMTEEEWEEDVIDVDS